MNLFNKKKKMDDTPEENHEKVSEKPASDDKKSSQEVKLSPCLSCEGDGKTGAVVCTVCNGSGEV